MPPRVLHAEVGTAGVPVIFLTGRTEPADVERVLAGGALGCVKKPFNALTLGADVLRLFEAWRAQR